MKSRKNKKPFYIWMKKSIRRKSPLRKQFTNAYNNKPFMNYNKPEINYNMNYNKPEINYNNKPFMNYNKPKINYNNKPFMNYNKPEINYNFMYSSDKIQPINNNIKQTSGTNDNENFLAEIDPKYYITKNEKIDPYKGMTDHEKDAEIFSNPVLKDPEYVAKINQIDELQKQTNELEKRRDSIGTSTSSEWQRLDKKIFEMYDEKRDLIKESHLIADNFRENNRLSSENAKDGKRRQKKKSRSRRKRRSKKRRV